MRLKLFSILKVIFDFLQTICFLGLLMFAFLWTIIFDRKFFKDSEGGREDENRVIFNS